MQVVLAAVEHEGWALQYAAPKLRSDREIVRAAVDSNQLALEFAAPELRAAAGHEGFDAYGFDARTPRTIPMRLLRQRTQKVDKRPPAEVHFSSVLTDGGEHEGQHFRC